MGYELYGRPAAASDEDLLAGCGSLHVEAELVSELVGADCGRFVTARTYQESGADGTRTHDLAAASRTLSQLSYSPRELKFSRVVYRRSLGVLGWGESKLKRGLTGHELERDQIARARFRAMDTDQIELVGFVASSDTTAWRVPTARQVDAEDSPSSIRRLALDLEQACSYVEDEVVSTMLCHRAEYLHTRLGCFVRDGSLGDRSSVIGVHEEMFRAGPDAHGPIPPEQTRKSGETSASVWRQCETGARRCGWARRRPRPPARVVAGRRRGR